MPIRKSRIEKCAKCTKSVYANEKLEAVGKVYHNTCFRCATCDKRLTMITYCEGPDKNPHCQTCYNSSFGPKGYGFGDTAIGEFEEHGKAENAGLKSRSATYKESKPMPGAPPASKPAWQVKQENKIAKSKAKKAEREAALASKAADGEKSTAEGSTGGSKTGGEGSKKHASWAAKPKARKMKIKKRGIPKCARCGKSVYANEKIEAMGKDFHTSCFHCIE